MEKKKMKGAGEFSGSISQGISEYARRKVFLESNPGCL
jgi:hypothetical protein